MRDKPNRVTCALATANGFDVPYRPSASSARTDRTHKDARRPATRVSEADARQFATANTVSSLRFGSNACRWRARLRATGRA